MRKQLEENGGIPAGTLLLMSAVAGLTVANLYYIQPLLEAIRADLGCSSTMANLITVVTQAGYALGLLLIVPMADMWSRRKITVSIMSIAALMAAGVALSHDIRTALAASFGLGLCSVIPQIFIPAAGLFSRPENKSRNMGYILSGLLTGILGARVISGYVGEWLGWRAMFAIAAVLMLVCMAVTHKTLPSMSNTFSGTYSRLLGSVWKIFTSRPDMRIYSLRGACSFGSMMAIWSCMAFHLAGEPFYAGSNTTGLLGLCGIVGAAAAGSIGKTVPRLGIRRMTLTGSLLQMAAWVQVIFSGDTYPGLIAAIILLEVGAQFQQLGNQSGCLQAIPEASNRSNTIFMTALFLGGSIATFCANLGWEHLGWNGVCLTGAVLSVLPLLTVFTTSGPSSCAAK